MFKKMFVLTLALLALTVGLSRFAHADWGWDPTPSCPIWGCEPVYDWPGTPVDDSNLNDGDNN